MATEIDSNSRPFADSYAALVAAGIPFIAVKTGQKEPLFDKDLQPNGSRSPVTDSEVAFRLAAKYPTANIGRVTGALSGSNLVDLDGPHAEALLTDAGLTIPKTLTVRTRRGKHIYVAYDPALPQGAGLLVAACACAKPCQVDTRADGGFGVFPPSVVDGHTYSFDLEVVPAPWPEFTALIVSTKPRPVIARTSRSLPVSSDSLISRVKALWTVEEIAVRLGVRLFGRGDQLKGKCPLHRERNGYAFAIWRAAQHWRCFGKCNLGGDQIDLYRAARERGLL